MCYPRTIPRSAFALLFRHGLEGDLHPLAAAASIHVVVIGVDDTVFVVDRLGAHAIAAPPIAADVLVVTDLLEGCAPAGGLDFLRVVPVVEDAAIATGGTVAIRGVIVVRGVVAVDARWRVAGGFTVGKPGNALLAPGADKPGGDSGDIGEAGGSGEPHRGPARSGAGKCFADSGDEVHGVSSSSDDPPWDLHPIDDSKRAQVPG